MSRASAPSAYRAVGRDDDRSEPSESTSCCAGDQRAPRARSRRPAHRVRDDHGRRDGAGPSPCPGLGQRHRSQASASTTRPALEQAMPFVRHELGAASPQAHPGAPRPPRRLRRARQPRHAARSRAGGRPRARRHAATAIAADARCCACPTWATPPTPGGTGRCPGSTSSRRREPANRSMTATPVAPKAFAPAHAADDRDRAGTGGRPRRLRLRRPEAVIDRLRRRTGSSSSSHENPDADTLGATPRRRADRASARRRRDARLRRPSAAVYDFLPGIDRVRPTPSPASTYDLARRRRLRHARADRRGPRASCRPLRGLPRVTIDHHVSNDAAGDADWVDPAAAATCEMVALLAARLGVPLDADDGALATDLMAGIVMDTATFAASQHHPADADGRRGPPRGRRAAVRDLAPALPDQARRAAPAVRPCARPPRDHADGRVVWSTLLDGDLRGDGLAARRIPRASSISCRSPRPPRSRSCSRRPVRRHADQRPDQARRRRRHGADGRVRRWGSRACRGGDHRPTAPEAARGRPGGGAPPAGRRGGPLSPRGPRPPGLDGILVVAKPAGPTSHDVVALVRRLSATRRVGHGGTLDPFASGVLPVFLGHATRLVGVPPRRPRATGDDLLRRGLHDRRPRGRADARVGPAPDRAAVEAALRRFLGEMPSGRRRSGDPGRRSSGLRDRARGRHARAGPAQRHHPLAIGLVELG